MPGLDWLTSRPIAHRGLHDAAAGVIENTASAFTAAVAGRYAIECDLQLSADGEAMVFHDSILDRLTTAQGPVAAMTARELQAVPFKATADRIMTLGELCALVEDRVSLVIELKSNFNSDTRMATRAADVLRSYAGPAAVMSFDPAMIAAVAGVAPGLPRGVVGERGLLQSHGISDTAYLQALMKARPQFLAWSVKDLRSALPWTARNLFGLPLLTWTVRSLADWSRAKGDADQMIFEGFRP